MFDIKKHLIKVQGGRQYLPVAARLIWFRTEHPDWGIETKAIAVDVEKQYAIFESTVYNAEGKLMAKGTKMENVRGFGDWLEKAETGAIGRALAVCGYGTQFAPDLDESHTGGSLETHESANGYYDERNRYEQRQPNEGQANGRYDRNGAKDGLALIDGHTNNQKRTDGAGDFAATEGKSEACEVCTASLKPSQLSLSLRKFGAALCPDCQRKRKAEEAA
jgi:hypothetical protein